MRNEVIYLTGVPAVGKSTLTSRLRNLKDNLIILEYGAILAENISRIEGREVSQEDLKKSSSVIVRPEHVRSTDELILRRVLETRAVAPVILDTHAVTVENYGFRVTPFSAKQMAELSPSRVVFLVAEPETIIQRISDNPQGRPLPTLRQLENHSKLQMAVAVSYAVHLGVPLYQFSNENDDSEAERKILSWI